MLTRTCYKTVLSRLAMFPTVALLGPRQVGKTTLAEAIAGDRDSVYLDLENPFDEKHLAVHLQPVLAAHKGEHAAMARRKSSIRVISARSSSRSLCASPSSRKSKV